MALADPIPSDLEWSETSGPVPEPQYPTGPIGDLMRQRDAALSVAENYRGLSVIYGQQADTNQATADQLQSAIDLLTAAGT